VLIIFDKEKNRDIANASLDLFNIEFMQ
jgi:hypothetical protein